MLSAAGGGCWHGPNRPVQPRNEELYPVVEQVGLPALLRAAHMSSAWQCRASRLGRLDVRVARHELLGLPGNRTKN